MVNSTKQKRSSKPRPDFPLFPHATGYWAKKVCGTFHYFGKVASDPKGDAALKLWLDRKDDLLAGRTPRVASGGLTVHSLCNQFVAAKEQQMAAGDIRPATFHDYYSTCKFVLGSFGKNRLVDDLAPDDFQSLRVKLAKRYGPHALSREVQQTRTLFKYGTETGLIEKPVLFGPMFKRPEKRILRAHRQECGPRMFEAWQIQMLLKKADQPLKAMILLGINCGFGNTDCGTLPRHAVDIDSAIVSFPRPKTAIERRCPLWPETVAAICEAMDQRPKAKRREHDKLVFVTKYGQPWSKDTSTNPMSQEFRKLIDAVDAAASKDVRGREVKQPLKIYRYGLGFYALRHTFETIGGESKDQVAVNHIMGHADGSMAAVYRERISDERLLAVTDHVHQWLFGKAPLTNKRRKAPPTINQSKATPPKMRRKNK